jgi:Zn-dependent protease
MNPVTVIGVAGIAVVSITSHEAAHGFMADRLGDPTARERGRLTLNPIPHIDLFFTILLPLFLILSNSGFIFGGAKPVPVDVSRLRNPRRDWALVGAAGPVLNVLLAIERSSLGGDAHGPGRRVIEPDRDSRGRDLPECAAGRLQPDPDPAA